MAYINVIEPENAEGTLSEVYDEIISKRGKIANVIKAQSLNPTSMQQHLDLYMTLMFGSSKLKRYQREMIAVVVSSANNCDYCLTHHSAALNLFWKDDGKIVQLQDDFNKVNLSQEDHLICQLAVDLTKNPGNDGRDEQINMLKEAGFDDGTILDITLIISYFNFVNRMVLGLGVSLDMDKGKGYKYD